ncbi:hypothetical protein AB6A40_008829 [Gnathostoma spinigerum]|uniref:Uncharacterized protein n=1 Tax=Gnathostoma spinigerum TaxID=75299 RepID=A0ABD6ERE5_9BILA
MLQWPTPEYLPKYLCGRTTTKERQDDEDLRTFIMSLVIYPHRLLLFTTLLDILCLSQVPSINVTAL